MNIIQIRFTQKQTRSTQTPFFRFTPIHKQQGRFLHTQTRQITSTHTSNHTTITSSDSNLKKENRLKQIGPGNKKANRTVPLHKHSNRNKIQKGRR